jgi:hypothetical protein
VAPLASLRARKDDTVTNTTAASDFAPHVLWAHALRADDDRGALSGPQGNVCVDVRPAPGLGFGSNGTATTSRGPLRWGKPSMWSV